MPAISGPSQLLKSWNRSSPCAAFGATFDGEKVRAAMPKDLQWECQGLRVYMTHIEDPQARREIASYKPGLFICGHSHILKVTRASDLCLHLNPGAAGHHGWHKVRTILRFAVAQGRLTHLEAIELGPRGSANAT
jgi:predicted phosphodiesterase